MSNNEVNHGSSEQNDTSTKKQSRRDMYRPPAAPDYSDPEDVIKYLFEAGIVSPSHAAALLITLGFIRPEGGMTDELLNDVSRIKNDLRARMAMYQEQKRSRFEQQGMVVLEAFITQSGSDSNLRLILDDIDTMVSVGTVLVNLHRLEDVRNGMPPERPDKYDGMGVKIIIDE